MEKPVFRKVRFQDTAPQVLKWRKFYKMVDTDSVGSKQITCGIAVVEPGGICEPGHSHTDQEEVVFCLTGKGVLVLGDDRERVELSPREAIFIPPFVYHRVDNPSSAPFEILSILSPAGWVFDRHPDWEAKARRGEALDE